MYKTCTIEVYCIRYAQVNTKLQHFSKAKEPTLFGCTVGTTTLQHHGFSSPTFDINMNTQQVGQFEYVPQHSTATLYIVLYKDHAQGQNTLASASLLYDN